jgi:demethylmenaquinone methyltransferase/2-methoxy-6-polyprenyl-1,4-benzoquinol methylase
MANAIADRSRAATELVRRLIRAGAPDRERALRRYGAMAAEYHRRTVSGDHFRRHVVARLAPLPGEVILDVGCGTGLNFKAIREAIGPSGRLIGVELSPRMLDVARGRIERFGWSNVELVEGDVAEAEIPATADAALLCAVHDVMRSPAALANVLEHLRDGGRAVAGGPKWACWRRADGLSSNLSTWMMNRECVTTFEGFARPWSHLERLADSLVVDEVFGGGGYIASAAWRRTNGAAAHA